MHEEASASLRAENEHAAKQVEHEEATACRMAELETELRARSRELAENYEAEQHRVQNLRQQLVMERTKMEKHEDFMENEMRKAHELRSECAVEERAAESQQESLSTAQAVFANIVKQEKRTTNQAQRHASIAVEPKAPQDSDSSNDDDPLMQVVDALLPQAKPVK